MSNATKQQIIDEIFRRAQSAAFRQGYIHGARQEVDPSDQSGGEIESLLRAELTIVLYNIGCLDEDTENRIEAAYARGFTSGAASVREEATT